MNSRKIAVALLCTNYDADHSEYYSQLGDLEMDFYTFVDSAELVQNFPPHHNIVQIPDAECVSVGLSRMNPTNPKISQVCAWEKALYFFTHVNDSYEYVWFIEYDVFVPNLELIASINQEFEEMNYAPIEFIFHTIALRDKMTIQFPKPFKHVTFKHRRRILFYYEESEWQPQEIEGKYFYHPVKKFTQQQFLLDNFQRFSPFNKTSWKLKKNIEFFFSYLLHAPLFYLKLVQRYYKSVKRSMK